MPRRLTPTLVAAAFGVVLLAGCSGGPSSADPTDLPNVEPSSSAPATSSDSPSPTTSPSPSSPTSTTKSAQPNGDAGAPGVPAAARKHTKTGAEAFARHYVAVINETGIHPATGKLEPLATEGCKSCHNYAGNVRYLVKHHEHNAGPAAEVQRTSSRSGPPGMRAWVLLNQLPVRVLDRSGSVVRTEQRVNNVALVFDLGWEPGGGWRAKEIFVDRSGQLLS